MLCTIVRVRETAVLFVCVCMCTRNINGLKDCDDAILQGTYIKAHLSVRMFLSCLLSQIPPMDVLVTHEQKTRKEDHIYTQIDEPCFRGHTHD